MPGTDALRPVLRSSPPLPVTIEQDDAIKRVLLLCASDAKFADKAADALKIILHGGINEGLTIASISPAISATGTVTVNLTVTGTKFDASCVIMLNGSALPTSFISATELKASFSLTGVLPGQLPVSVRNAQNVESNAVAFTVTSA